MKNEILKPITSYNKTEARFQGTDYAANANIRLKSHAQYDVTETELEELGVDVSLVRKAILTVTVNVNVDKKNNGELDVNKFENELALYVHPRAKRSGFQPFGGSAARRVSLNDGNFDKAIRKILSINNRTSAEMSTVVKHLSTVDEQVVKLTKYLYTEINKSFTREEQNVVNFAKISQQLSELEARYTEAAVEIAPQF